MTPPLSAQRHAHRAALVIDLVGKEVARARVLFPGASRRLSAMMEEAGEVATALMDVEDGKVPRSAFVAECVQLAAMAVRLAIEGDAAFPATLADPPFNPAERT